MSNLSFYGLFYFYGGMKSNVKSIFIYDLVHSPGQMSSYLQSILIYVFSNLIEDMGWHDVFCQIYPYLRLKLINFKAV